MIVFGHNGAVAPDAIANDVLVRWVSERLGIADFGPCVTIGVQHKGEIVAVALYNKYLHPNIEITFAIGSPCWASPGAVRAIFAYPIIQLGCKRITATTHHKNEKARAFNVRLGFKQEGYHPDVFEDGDAVTYGLLRKDAERWLKDRHEQSNRTD